MDTGSMVSVEPERFEAMVGEALDGLPEELGTVRSDARAAACATIRA